MSDEAKRAIETLETIQNNALGIVYKAGVLLEWAQPEKEIKETCNFAITLIQRNEAVKRYFNVDMCPQLQEVLDESLIEVGGDKSKLSGFDTSIESKDCCWWKAREDVLKILEGNE